MGSKRFLSSLAMLPANEKRRLRGTDDTHMHHGGCKLSSSAWAERIGHCAQTPVGVHLNENEMKQIPRNWKPDFSAFGRCCLSRIFFYLKIWLNPRRTHFWSPNFER
ncbi:hypothetical protein TNCV_2700891 [Trichonephila clavipes]|nr:hypothetical protein TNCV_2700891 [Trichonephila clavipes]